VDLAAREAGPRRNARRGGAPRIGLDTVDSTVYSLGMPKAGPLWTLEELGHHLARALAASPTPSVRGQASEVPTERTIRYYGTLGLLDPAVERRGLRALYGRQHLLQLVAIKRLQAQGLPLKEVQERLVGLTTGRLEAIAQLPEMEPRPDIARRETTQPLEWAPRRTTAFWAERPAPPERQLRIPLVPTAPGAPGPGDAAQLDVFQGVRLADAVTVLFASSRSLTQEDIEAIRIAAVPLLTTASARGLLPPEPTR